MEKALVGVDDRKLRNWEPHLDALHGCGVRHQPLLGTRLGLALTLLRVLGGLVDVVHAHQQRVVHDLEGLQHATVSLHRCLHR